jgi:hypothetical protein
MYTGLGREQGQRNWSTKVKGRGKNKWMLSQQKTAHTGNQKGRLDKGIERRNSEPLRDQREE